MYRGQIPDGKGNLPFKIEGVNEIVSNQIQAHSFEAQR